MGINEGTIPDLKETLEYLRDLEDGYVTFMLAAVNALETHESYLFGHNERVAIFACEIARMLGCNPQEIENIRLASMLQDIGEITIPTYILQKATQLTEDEWNIIRNHPKVSAELVGKVRKWKPVADIVYAHQEKFDGSGYPRGLKGEDIPLGARILSIVNTYDALTNIRLHRETGNHENAIREIQRLSGAFYDPKIVEVFLTLF